MVKTMAEYIDRSAIKYEQWAVGPLNAPLMVVRKKTINKIPAADVVEIVRCKDCKHYKDAPWYAKPEIGTKICRSPNLDYDTECGDLWMWMNPDDFCSYGERREADG